KNKKIKIGYNALPSTKGNMLYRKDRQKKNNWLKVIQTFEIEPILFLAYNHLTGGHM
ncbi:13508_t:CDS:2, partial [Cetraspora pellucida]